MKLPKIPNKTDKRVKWLLSYLAIASTAIFSLTFALSSFGQFLYKHFISGLGYSLTWIGQASLSTSLDLKSFLMDGYSRFDFAQVIGNFFIDISTWILNSGSDAVQYSFDLFDKEPVSGLYIAAIATSAYLTYFLASMTRSAIQMELKSKLKEIGDREEALEEKQAEVDYVGERIEEAVTMLFSPDKLDQWADQFLSSGRPALEEWIDNLKREEAEVAEAEDGESQTPSEPSDPPLMEVKEGEEPSPVTEKPEDQEGSVERQADEPEAELPDPDQKEEVEPKDAEDSPSDKPDQSEGEMVGKGDEVEAEPEPEAQTEAESEADREDEIEDEDDSDYEAFDALDGMDELEDDDIRRMAEEALSEEEMDRDSPESTFEELNNEYSNKN